MKLNHLVNCTASGRARGIAAEFTCGRDMLVRVVRVDAPLPGDLVIRRKVDGSRPRPAEVFVITLWPDPDTVEAGPYQSYGYALRQAQSLLKDRSERIWYDHARAGHPEELEQVGGHGH